MGDKKSVGLLFIGIALGMYLPDVIPADYAALNPYLGIIFLILAAFLIVKG